MKHQSPLLTRTGFGLHNTVGYPLIEKKKVKPAVPSENNRLCITCILEQRFVLRRFFRTKINFWQSGYMFAEYNQQDATFHNSFISVRRCTRCRRFFRPSSGAQNYTYSVRYLSDQYLTLYVQFWAPDDGRKTRLKHAQRLTEINKLWNVASCWLYSANILAMHGPMNVKKWIYVFFKMSSLIGGYSNLPSAMTTTLNPTATFDCYRTSVQLRDVNFVNYQTSLDHS